MPLSGDTLAVMVTVGLTALSGIKGTGTAFASTSEVPGWKMSPISRSGAS